MPAVTCRGMTHGASGPGTQGPKTVAPLRLGEIITEKFNLIPWAICSTHCTRPLVLPQYKLSRSVMVSGPEQRSCATTPLDRFEIDPSQNHASICDRSA